MRRRVEALAERLGDARLADAGFAREQEDLAFAGRRPVPPLHQHAEFVVAADQGQERAAQRFEPTLGGPFADDQPRMDGFVDW